MKTTLKKRSITWVLTQLEKGHYVYNGKDIFMKGNHENLYNDRLVYVLVKPETMFDAHTWEAVYFDALLFTPYHVFKKQDWSVISNTDLNLIMEKNHENIGNEVIADYDDSQVHDSELT